MGHMNNSNLFSTLIGCAYKMQITCFVFDQLTNSLVYVKNNCEWR